MAGRDLPRKPVSKASLLARLLAHPVTRVAEGAAEVPLSTLAMIASGGNDPIMDAVRSRIDRARMETGRTNPGLLGGQHGAGPDYYRLLGNVLGMVGSGGRMPRLRFPAGLPRGTTDITKPFVSPSLPEIYGEKFGPHYPVGTIVRTTDGTVGRVVSHNFGLDEVSKPGETIGDVPLHSVRDAKGVSGWKFEDLTPLSEQPRPGQPGEPNPLW